MLAFKHKIHTETSATHLRINLAHLQQVFLVLTSERSGKPCRHTVYVVFVNPCLNLEITQVVNLSYLHSGTDALSEFDIQQSEFTVDSGTHIKFRLALPDKHHIAPHVLKIVLHLLHLHRAVDGILTQTFRDKAVLLG